VYGEEEYRVVGLVVLIDIIGYLSLFLSFIIFQEGDKFTYNICRLAYTSLKSD